MRILLVWPNAEMSIYDVATGIRSGFVAEGHEIVDYRLYRRFKMVQAGAEAYRPKDAPDDTAANMVELCGLASEALPQIAILRRPDWILVVCGMGLHPDSLLALKRAGFKIAVWFTEAPYNTDEAAELYLAQFCDVAFVNERTSVSDFQQKLDTLGRGGTATYLPHAYNPDTHRPGMPEDDVDPDLTCDVLLIGTGFRERQALLECIDWTGIDLRIAGYWPGILRPSYIHKHVYHAPVPSACVPNPLTAQWYRQAKIVLNPHRSAPFAESANPRTYEAAACQAFQISDFREEIGEVFGDAIPTYETGVAWQLDALIRRYLADDNARRACAQRAYYRVQPHTFRTRAQTIVRTLQQWEAEHERLRVLRTVAVAG